MKTFAISREHGSGGSEIAKKLSEELGIRYYDKNLLLITAEKYGIGKGIMDELDEKRFSRVHYGTAMPAETTSQEEILFPYKVYQAQRETILRLAGEGPGIFVGRCADHILKDDPRVCRVFIYASSREEKISRVAARDDVSRKDAAEFILQRDRQRQDYYYFHTGQKWGDRNQYDICLNTSTLGLPLCVKILKDLAKESA